MKKLAALVLALGAGAGCYAQGYGSTGYVGGGTYVAYSSPAPAYTDDNVYYEDREGQVYINGHYAWMNGAWAWTPGYYEAERPGYAYVQGYWAGNNWYDGRWEANRPGYVYTGGYWDRRAGNHVWVNGNWEPNRGDSVYVRGTWGSNNGVRTYNRGSWRPSNGGGAIIRDHRHR